MHCVVLEARDFFVRLDAFQAGGHRVAGAALERSADEGVVDPARGLER